MQRAKYPKSHLSRYGLLNKRLDDPARIIFYVQISKKYFILFLPIRHPSTCGAETSAILSNSAANPPLGKGRGYTAAHQLPTWATGQPCPAHQLWEEQGTLRPQAIILPFQ